MFLSTSSLSGKYVPCTVRVPCTPARTVYVEASKEAIHVFIVLVQIGKRGKLTQAYKLTEVSFS